MKTQMSSIIWCFVLFTGLVTTACGDSPTESPSVQFSVLAVNVWVNPMSPQVLNTGSGELEITGTVRTACDAFDANGEFNQLGDTLMATVTPVQLGQCIFDIPAQLLYRFTLTRLDPAGYRLILVHAVGGRPDVVALDTLVTVF